MTNPTRLVSVFDDSLAFTDADEVGTWTGVDPIRFDDGLWIEKGTTNHILNPTAVTDLTGWSDNANRLEARVTTLPDSLPDPNITTCFQVTATATILGGAAVLYPSSAITLTNAAYTYSGYVYVPSSWTAVGNVGLQVDGFASATGDLFALVDFGERDVWQFLQCTFTPAAGDLSGYTAVRVFSGGWVDTEFLYVAGLQCELGSYPTSFSLNSFGDGYSGTTTHIRAASSASIDPADRIDPASGSIAMRYKRLIDTGAEEIILTSGVAGAGTDYLEIGVDTSDDLYMEWNSNGGGANRVTIAATIAVNTEYFFYFDWDGTAIRASIDNGSLGSDTRDAVEGDWSTGDLTLSAAVGSHVIGPFAVFDRPLETKEITYLYTHGTWSFGMLPLGSRANIFQLRPKAVT